MALTLLASIGEKLLFAKFRQAQRAAVCFSHEAVNDIGRVEEKSGHRPIRSNTIDVRTLAGTRACAWNVELNERAVLIAHETVIHIVLVSIPSRDRSTGIDSKRVGTLEGTWDVTGVRSIKRGEDALPIH